MPPHPATPRRSALARGLHPQAKSAPAVGTKAGKRANIATFALFICGSLAQGWALISLGYALGALRSAHAWQPWALSALASTGIYALTQWGANLSANLSALEQEVAIRRRALGHLLHLGANASARSGASVSLLTDGAARIASYRQTFLAPTAGAMVAPALVLVLLAVSTDWVSALVLALGVIVVPGFIGLFLSKGRRSSSGSRQQRTRLSAQYLDAIQGLTTLTLARASSRIASRLRQTGEDNRRAVMKLLASNQLVILLTDALFSLFFITASCGCALMRLHAGALDAGSALAVALISFVMLEPLDHVGSFFYVGMGGMASQRALRRLLALTPASGATPASSHIDDGSAVRLDAVNAAWNPEHPVLKNVNLQVNPQEQIAIVGASGAGKSTLLALICGDLLPQSGTVYVGGKALTAQTQAEIRAASAVVAQTTWLFTGSIADNLRLADPQASPERMWQALQAANLAEEVRALPQGLDTQLAEQGLGLSGGQAQRLSLARAFLADRPLLILDEPTSQVDLDCEAQIVQAIARLASGRTVLTVSHRPGALGRTQRVVTVQAGGVQ